MAEPVKQIDTVRVTKETWDLLKNLPTKAQAAKCLYAVLQYQFEGEMPPDKSLPRWADYYFRRLTHDIHGALRRRNGKV